jgi:hypothetical protein
MDTSPITVNGVADVANPAMKQMRGFLTEFDMTPSSRSRGWSSLPPVRDEKAEKFFGWCR